MILITGATGTVGASLVEQLVAGGHPVRAFVTDIAAAQAKLGDKVELARGNFTDPTSVDAALGGVDKLYLLAPAGPDEPAWEAAVIAAAQRAGVKHVVYHSVAGAQYEANAFGRWHRAAEKLLERSKLAWTILRPAGFMSNALGWAATIKSQGAIYMPCGQGKMAYIDPRDIAAVAAAALVSPGHDGKAYELTGPEPLSIGDQASALAAAIGKPVKYVDVPDAAARDAMIGIGMPAVIADGMLEITGFVRSGNAASVSNAVQTVTGKPARTFAAWCKEHVAAFA
jgi:uncharacterized protein YbjT (DUF2867 family)